MEIEQFEFFKKQRTYIRGKITRTCNEVANAINNLDLETCKTYIEKLHSLEFDIKAANDKVANGLWIHVKEDVALHDEFSKCDTYSNAMADSLRLLVKRKEVLVAPDHESSQRSILDPYPSMYNQPASTGMRLPAIALPTFTPRVDNLEEFFTNFENSVQKYNLNDHEKYIYLSGQVKGDALTTVSALKGSKRDYQAAKELLTRAFASVTVQKFEAIEKLRNLNLNPSGNCYEFASELKSVRQSFGDLKIEIDDILQYFAWQAMPTGLQNQFVNICNESKPKIEDIELKMYDAIDRYSLNKPKVERSSPKTNAVS